VVVQDEERAAKSVASGGQTTGSIQRPVRWFVDITSWEPIAMDLRQLVRAFDAGRIDADTLVWRKGMPDWSRLRDVSELAERLIGPDAQRGLAPPLEPAPEGAGFTSEPPPRQPERSRTPRASYAVGAEPEPTDLSRADTDGGAGADPDLRAAELVSDRVEDATGGRKKSRGRGSRPDLAVAPHEPRTITQTGLAAPPDAGRNSIAPVAARASSPPEHGAEAEASAKTNGGEKAAAPARARSPSGSQRRPRNADETPAQKPSSISVPPGAMTTPLSRSRAWPVVAIGALVVGAVVVQQLLSGPSMVPGGTPTAERAPGAAIAAESASGRAESLPVAEPPVEPAANPLVPEQPATTPRAPEEVAAIPSAKPAAVPAVPSAVAPTAAVMAKVPAQAPQGAPSGGGRATPTAATPPVPQPHAVTPPQAQQRKAQAVPAAPRPDPHQPAPAPAQAAPAPAPAKPAEAANGDDFGIDPAPPAGRAAPAPQKPADPQEPGASPPKPAPPKPASPPKPAAPPSIVPTAPSGAAPPAENPGASAPRAFDAQAAQQQMGIAAWKASTCGQMGPTRGGGEVSVLIESWGRVVRVTHKNSAFVGTAVGLCVMQAFQQVRVPPFDGNSQSLTGSFIVE